MSDCQFLTGYSSNQLVDYYDFVQHQSDIGYKDSIFGKNN